MKIAKRGRRKPIIPINSMSDIAFLLLIFIMLISLINYRQEVKIDYPEARDYESVNSDVNLELWVDKDGRFYADGIPTTQLALENLIATEIANNPSVRIHVIADRDTEYRHVNSVLEILQLLQHRVVSLVVKEQL